MREPASRNSGRVRYDPGADGYSPDGRSGVFVYAHFLHALKASVWGGFFYENECPASCVSRDFLCGIGRADLFDPPAHLSGGAYLVYDPADVPLAIATSMFGPWWGLAATAVASAVQASTVSADGIIGFCMHVFATGTYVIIAGLIYKGMGQNLRATIVSLVVATLAAAAMMVPLNLIFTPMYGTPIDAVKSLIWPVIIPFNLIKFGLNSIITAVVFRSVKYFVGKKA